MHPVQQKNRSKFANLKTWGLAEIGPLQNSQSSFIFSPFLILNLLFCCQLKPCLLFFLFSLSVALTSSSGFKILLSFSIISKLKTGDTDFINPTLTSLVNLALTVGVVMPVSRETSRNDLRPSFNNDFKIDTS